MGLCIAKTNQPKRAKIKSETTNESSYLGSNLAAKKGSKASSEDLSASKKPKGTFVGGSGAASATAKSKLGAKSK